MRKIFSSLAVNFIFCHVFAQSEIPLIGATKTIQAKVCRIDASCNERTKITSTYRPPTGWQILTFKPIVDSSIAVCCRFSETPSHFRYTSISAVYSKFIQLLELAAEKNVYQKYEPVINQMRNDFEKYFNHSVPIYSGITTTGSVNAINRFNKGKRGRLNLDLKITLVYMPDNDEQCLQSLEALKQLINME